MKPNRIAWLCAFSIGTGLAALPLQASAQGNWSGGSPPVFQSDIEQQQRQAEAKRAERRKSYSVTYPRYMSGGDKPDIAAEAPEIVYLSADEQPGTIIVDTNGRKLYYVLPGKRAYEYPISVGRVGFTWTGTERVSRIAAWPSWTPPADMRRRDPGLPITVSGGVINPLGAKALYLGSSIYRIHGTNNARSIGRASSSGCFRMMNKHVVHLATLARIGTKVRVVSSYSGVSGSAPITSFFSGFSFGSAEAAKQSAAPAKGKTSSGKAATAKTKSKTKTN